MNFAISSVKVNVWKWCDSLLKIAWGMTGAGHFLAECVDLAVSLEQADIFLSRAAVEVIKMYRMAGRLEKGAHPVFPERSASAPEVGGFYTGKYRLLVIAPATSNSVAKFVHGISDTLIANLFAHAGKGRVPAVVLPSDVGETMLSPAPGKTVTVFPRDVDLANVEKLAAMERVTVVRCVEELKACLASCL
ncbi:hypothetical protein SY88_20955 [Clostridiales bacterium PH28_bin88]|nr:hypothetical protein SY88_20955 [Clostridiales bacterium PH28_bin88]